jgi:hypothetical protein
MMISVTSSAKLIVVAVLILRPGVAQNHSDRLPTFEDFPVKDIFDGGPHPPILATREQHLFRTRIRQGVEKGWGVRINGEWGKEKNMAGPNFAGRYAVIVWGCGAPCLRMAVCDLQTGEVFNPPLSPTGGLGLPWLVFPNSVAGNVRMDYRVDSQLMIIDATPHSDRPGAKPYSFYFLFQDGQWKLLRRVPLD